MCRISSRLASRDLDAGDELSLLGGDDNRVIALLHLLVGLEQRVNEVIDGGTGANTEQVGADLSAGPADGMALQTAWSLRR